MTFIKDVFKGALIGVANVIPGVSGGTMALSMGVYEKIIHAINNLKKEFKQSLKALLPFAIGVVLGIALLSFVIKYSLENFAVPTLMLFVGLILGGLSPIIKKVENEQFKITHLISFLLFAAIIIVPTIIAGENSIVRDVNFSFVSIIIMLFMGIISAASMVVPGVSGSMILMMLGYYDTIISNITLFIKSLTAFNFDGIISSCGILIPFGIGVILGIIVTAKIIERLLKKYPLATMWAILALVVVSPFAILFNANLNTSIGGLIISALTFAIGFFISKKLGMDS